MFKNKKGFTLVEMLIVLMIISILMILIIPNLGDKSKNAQEKGCEALISVVQTQVDAYYLENYSYPSSLDTLVRDNYIRENQKTCANNSELTVNQETGKVSVSTNGNS
ncbi:competence type IV pilus major pilin ComGC [Ornithinibacillus contaminans]|uniref:competence type IV pilus major pilin ComGC n=1 Tax=Ornithinibacillus contaminans TaxID=694055 RepID=UPI00064DD71A|nr:competence type IV pilus major pilin ComGC [Ornithinibacillus contaminans]